MTISFLGQYNLHGIYNYIIYVYHNIYYIVKNDDIKRSADKFFEIINYSDELIIDQIDESFEKFEIKNRVALNSHSIFNFIKATHNYTV